MFLTKLLPVIVPILLLLAMACFCLWMAIHTWRIPDQVYKRHQRLRVVIKAANAGSISDEDCAILKDAERMGMVGAGFYVNSKGQLVLRRYYTNTAAGYLYDRVYPTSASIDAELEEFLIPQRLKD